MSNTCEHTRVVKKLSATQPGARKLARRYGSALVCVRYRCDKEGLIRYTTVELLVDQAAINKRKAGTDVVAVKLDIGELQLRQCIMSNGGQWDPHAYVWRLPRTTVKRLQLLDRVVAK